MPIDGGRGFAALILSPGVALTLPEPHRVVTLADAVGVPVLGDIELFAQALREATGAGQNGASALATSQAGHLAGRVGS